MAIITEKVVDTLGIIVTSTVHTPIPVFPAMSEVKLEDQDNKYMDLRVSVIGLLLILWCPHHEKRVIGAFE